MCMLTTNDDGQVSPPNTVANFPASKLRLDTVPVPTNRLMLNGDSGFSGLGLPRRSPKIVRRGRSRKLMKTPLVFIIIGLVLQCESLKSREFSAIYPLCSPSPVKPVQKAGQ